MAIETIVASKKTNRDEMIDVICGDSNTKIVRLTIPVKVDGVDLSGMTWAINSINAVGTKDTHAPSNIQIIDDIIYVDWTIHGIVTQEPGIAQFQYEGYSDGGVWQTAKMYLRVKERIGIVDGPEYEEQLNGIRELIIYVEGELQNVIQAGELAREAATHPPIIGDNGNWFLYDLENKQYIDSEKPSLSDGVYFETDETLSLIDGVLSVNTSKEPDPDNTLPITSAAVQTAVGNINSLLETI